MDPRTIDVLELFIADLKRLVGSLERYNPKDLAVQSLKRRVIIGCRDVPTHVIELVGKYMIPYHKEIFDGSFEFFMDNNYSDEILKASNDDDIDIVKHIIAISKRTFEHITLNERGTYIALAQDMLDKYLEYKGSIIDRQRMAQN